MGKKTIAINSRIHARLKSLKHDGESFSELIDRLTARMGEVEPNSSFQIDNDVTVAPVDDQDNLDIGGDETTQNDAEDGISYDEDEGLGAEECNTAHDLVRKVLNSAEVIRFHREEGFVDFANLIPTTGDTGGIDVEVEQIIDDLDEDSQEGESTFSEGGAREDKPVVPTEWFVSIVLRLPKLDGASEEAIKGWCYRLPDTDLSYIPDFNWEGNQIELYESTIIITTHESGGTIFRWVGELLEYSVWCTFEPNTSQLLVSFWVSHDDNK